MARLVVSRVFSKQGERLAQWHWLTNVEEVDAATVALWYDWRWRIESFFKRLQSAGHQLEYWQPESALAIAKRLLVASETTRAQRLSVTQILCAGDTALILDEVALYTIF